MGLYSITLHILYIFILKIHNYILKRDDYLLSAVCVVKEMCEFCVKLSPPVITNVCHEISSKSGRAFLTANYAHIWKSS